MATVKATVVFTETVTVSHATAIIRHSDKPMSNVYDMLASKGIELRDVIHADNEIMAFNVRDLCNTDKNESVEQMVEQMYSEYGFNKLAKMIQGAAEERDEPLADIRAVYALEHLRNLHLNTIHYHRYLDTDLDSILHLYQTTELNY